MDTYFARLTWNLDNWKRPSGFIPRSERGTYVAGRGFGHEEWLNRPEWVLDGWRCGYIEGVGRSSRLVGSKIRLVLFSINSQKERFFVGEIRSAEVLTDKQAANAHRRFRRQGWIATMIRELEDRIGPSKEFRGDVADTRGFMNVRFRSNAISVFDEPVPIPAGHALRRYARYGLMLASSASEKGFHETTRSAMRGLKATAVRMRRAVEQTQVDPIESRMQNEMRQILEERFGHGAVDAERDFVDIQVKNGNHTTMIELKSSTSARRAIREALGQLLDYAYFKNASSKARLLVVGRGVLRAEDARFVETLRRRFRIPIDYRRYEVGSKRFTV